MQFKAYQLRFETWEHGWAAGESYTDRTATLKRILDLDFTQPIYDCFVKTERE